MPAAARTEIRLSGSGGQGIILAATLIADAAAAAGAEVVQTQSYGPEARGGASRAEVIVSGAEIDFPEVTVPDITLCLSQEAFDRYAATTGRGGLVLYDARLVEPREIAGLRLVGVPFTELAEQRLGKAIAANVVATGALQALTRVVGRRELTAAVKRRVPARFLDLNLDALRLGFAAVEEARPRRRRSAAPSP